MSLQSGLPTQQGQVELKDVYTALFPAQQKWKNIGLQLGIDNCDLNKIATDHQNSEDQLREMLGIRKEQGGLTWEKIVEVLENITVGKNKLAATIRKKYMYPQPSAPQPSTSSNTTTGPTRPTTQSVNEFKTPIPKEVRKSPLSATVPKTSERGSFRESSSSNAKTNAVAKYPPHKPAPPTKRSPTNPKTKSTVKPMASKAMGSSNYTGSPLGKREKDHSKTETPKKKVAGGDTGSSSKTGSLLGKRERQSGMEMLKNKQQKTTKLDPLSDYYDKSIFVREYTLNKYCCVKCNKIPKKAFQKACCDAGKEMGVYCLNCTPACASCDEVNYAYDSTSTNNVRKLKVFCPNKVNGCQETVTLIERDRHVESCLYTGKPRMLSCKYKKWGCEKEFPEKDKETHEKDRELHFDLAMDAILDLEKRVDTLQKQSAAVATTLVPIPLVGEEIEEV